MRIMRTFLLLPAILVLGCSPSSDEERQPESAASAPESTEGAVSASMPETERAEGESTAADEASVEAALLEQEDAVEYSVSPSLLSAPLNESIVLPPLAPRPLPDVFEHIRVVLMEQTEPAAILFCVEGREMSEEERLECEEAREKALEAIEAMRELFLAQMALVRIPLEHPDYCSMTPEEREECISACEEYLAESFRRDVEGFSYDESFLERGCIMPGTRPGNQALLYQTELDLFLRTKEYVPSPNEDLLRRLDTLMEYYLECYQDYGRYRGVEGTEPFSRMYSVDEVVNWPHAADPAAEPTRVCYKDAMCELVRREYRAWKRYFSAMGELVRPCAGYRGSGMGFFRSLCESYLVASRERFIYMLMTGADNVVYLSERACEKAAELRELHAQYSFGEIFTESAVIFRHPRLAGNPWCIRFPSVGAGFIYLIENEELSRYLALHPEGGKTEVRGYQMLESRGDPYEVVRSESYQEYVHPAPKPYGAMELRQVFHLLEVPKESGE